VYRSVRLAVCECRTGTYTSRDGKLPIIGSHVGTPEQIVDRLIKLSKAGVDGLNMTFVNYQDELGRVVAEVIPLLEQAGLRAAVHASRHTGVFSRRVEVRPTSRVSPQVAVGRTSCDGLA